MINFEGGSVRIPNGDPTAALDRRGAANRRQRHSAPVDRLTPVLSEVPPLATVMADVLPSLQATVRILQELPQWIADTTPQMPGIPPASDAPVKGMQTHADKLSLSLDALRRYATLESYNVTLQDVDINPVLTYVLTRKLCVRPGPMDLSVELPRMTLDPHLIEGIAVGLTDAALIDARRADDKIGFRAMMAQDHMRLSVMYAGPPFDPAVMAALFRGRDTTKHHPATLLGLAFVWRATAMLGGTIEIGSGFMGVGARITVILPRL